MKATRFGMANMDLVSPAVNIDLGSQEMPGLGTGLMLHECGPGSQGYTARFYSVLWLMPAWHYIHVQHEVASCKFLLWLYTGSDIRAGLRGGCCWELYS